MEKVRLKIDDYRDVGGRAKHDCMDAGGRATQDAVAEEPEPRSWPGPCTNVAKGHDCINAGGRAMHGVIAEEARSDLSPRPINHIITMTYLSFTNM